METLKEKCPECGTGLIRLGFWVGGLGGQLVVACPIGLKLYEEGAHTFRRVKEGTLKWTEAIEKPG